MGFEETTSSRADGAPAVWERRAKRRKVLLGAGLPALFLGIGWALLTYVDGWFGVLLWILVAAPLCFLIEFLLRPRTATPRPPGSNPRMRVRVPVRGDPERSQPATRLRNRDFAWHDDKPSAASKRRRTYAR